MTSLNLPDQPIELIASDLDGTMLNAEHQLSDGNAAAITRAVAAGLRVVAATGRQLVQLPEELRASGVTHAVASNGAIGADLRTGEVLFEDLLDAATVRAILDHLETELPDARCSAVRDRGSHHVAEPGYLDLLAPEERIYWQHTQEVSREELVSVPTLKLTVRHPELTADDLLAVVAASGLAGCHPTTSGAPFLEIAGAKVTKATGVARLCGLFGIPATAVVAAGDAKNDVELLTWAGVGVAMGNAVPEAKAVADWVVGDHDEDGMAQLIDRLLVGAADPEPTEDDTRDLTNWAAAAAERALAGFADAVSDERVAAAIAAAKAWAQGIGSAEDSREAAFGAQQAARQADEFGHGARATAMRSAALAAASAGEPELAHQAAAAAVAAIEQLSAPCEQEFSVGTERRQQWQTLPVALRRITPEPPAVADPTCALPSS